MAALYQQAVLSIADPQRFGSIHQAIDAAFSAPGVLGFLKSLERSGLRVRHFEAVLSANMLGESAFANYTHLSNVDQGQIREIYLARLEQVAPELRQQFFKLYAYY